MSRPLRPVGPDETWAALRDALAGGDAVLPHSGRAPEGLPPRVEQRIALVVESSGSTGAPKRVALSASAVLASAAAASSALGAPGRWVLALPTSYIAGLNVLVRSIAAQTEPLVAAAPSEPFTPEAFAEAVSLADAITPLYTSLVPVQLRRLLDGPAAGIEALRRFDRVLVGGQRIDPELLARARERGVRVTRTYGSTESSGGCVWDGEPIGDTRVRIDDGEIWIATAALAEGYLDDAELTAARFVDRDGARWFRTADQGRIHDGRLTVEGRLDDVIVSGGVKIALSRIEALVRELPGHAGAIVVGVADEEWGESAAIVTDAPLSLLDARSVVAPLGVAARPSRVVVVDRLPELPSGKPDRMSARRLASNPPPPQ